MPSNRDSIKLTSLHYKYNRWAKILIEPWGYCLNLKAPAITHNKATPIIIVKNNQADF